MISASSIQTETSPEKIVAEPRSASPRIMVCEDETLIADDLCAKLEDMGYAVVGPFATQREAMRALRDDTPDAVILDVELRDGACTRLAGHLQEMGVHMVVLSGLAPSAPPPEFAQAAWLLKPATTRMLSDALRGVPAPLVRDGR